MAKTPPKKSDLSSIPAKQLIDELSLRSEQGLLSFDDLRLLGGLMEFEAHKGSVKLPTPKSPRLSHLVSMGFSLPYFCKVLTQRVYKKPSPEMRRVWLMHLKLAFPKEWVKLAEESGEDVGE